MRTAVLISVFLFCYLISNGQSVDYTLPDSINIITDIKNNNLKIFAYQALNDSLSKIACKYGRPYELLNSIAKKYNFQYQSTGCMISDERNTSYSNYNSQIIKELNLKNPNGWIQKFEEEVINQLIKQKGKYYEKHKEKLILNKC